MAFLIKGRNKKHTTPQFASALAKVTQWLRNSKTQLIPALVSAYTVFFEEFVVNKMHSIGELTSLFAFCRQLRANIDWIKSLKQP